MLYNLCMTRINVVPVEELCDQHLFAEFRELTRIPNTIKSGKAKVDINTIPKEYVLGAGHVKFFYNKLAWLQNRYEQLFFECIRRNINVTYIWPDDLISTHKHLFNNYVVTDYALQINRDRITERMPVKPRFSNKV